MGTSSSSSANGDDHLPPMTHRALRRALSDPPLTALAFMHYAEARHCPGIRVPPLPPMVLVLVNNRISETGIHIAKGTDMEKALTSPNWHRAASMDLTAGVDKLVAVAPRLRRLEVHVPYYVEKQLLARELQPSLVDLAVVAHYDVDLEFPTRQPGYQLAVALQRLHLDRIELTSLRGAVEPYLNTLRTLQLHSCPKLNDLSALQGASALHTLVINKCDLVGSTALHGIERLPQLEDVTLSWCCGVTNVNFLAASRSLKRLNLQGSRIPDMGIRRLGECRALEELNLSSCFTLTNIDHLAASRTLRSLSFDNTDVPTVAPVVEKVATLHQVAASSLSDVDVRVMCARYVHVAAAPTSDNALKNFLTLGSLLRSITTWETQWFTVKPSVLAPCMGLGEVTLLDLISDVDVTPLELLPRLTEVRLCGSSNSSTSLGQCNVGGSLQRSKSLRLLSVVNVGRVAEELLESLRSIPSLETIALTGIKTLRDVTALQHCAALKVVQLSLSGVTDSGIKGLHKLDALHALDLTGCVDISNVRKLKKAASLVTLSLLGTSVPDAEATSAAVLSYVARRNLLGCF